MPAHWLDWHVEWIVQKFPELSDTPIYVFGRDEVDPHSWLPSALAFTASGLDLECENILVERNRWRGRGCAIIIQDVEWWISAEWCQQIAVLLHELSHFLENGGKQPYVPKDERTSLEQFVAIPGGRELLTKAFFSEAELTQLSLKSHDHTFVRPALHCWYRSRWEISLDDMLVFSDLYHSPDQKRCIDVLMPELKRTDERILDIIAEPNEAFKALWDSQAEQTNTLASVRCA